MLQPGTLSFLSKIKKHNTREWMVENKLLYENVQRDFILLVNSLIQKFSTMDTSLATLTPKQCVFRLHRDVRFSKNKSPYKTNFGAFFSMGGRKSGYAGYYIHIEPNQSFLGGGLYLPMAPDLRVIRNSIETNFSEFETIMKNKRFISIYKKLVSDDEFMLKKVPRGFSNESPAAEYLKRTSFLVRASIRDELITSKKLLPMVLRNFEILFPMISFLNNSLLIAQSKKNI